MRFILVALALCLSINSYSQPHDEQENSLTFLFIGDIMGHDTQINSAYDEKTETYDYYSCIAPLEPIINNVDFAIANLEVTLAGPPFKGYPQFSSPDQLAIDFMKAGIDVFATANNHSCDRRKQGILRTIDVLDSIKIAHTGTFKNSEEKEKNNPLILEKNGIRVALLNYTYGTNGIPVPTPTIVNMIDIKEIAKDIEKSKSKNVDQIIVFMHWGLEYQSEPNKEQIYLANFCLSRGVDIIIGSHPHVIQKAIWQKGNPSDSDTLIAYSLGNFVSNQRKPRTDGGMMFQFTITKEGGITKVTDAGYHLTWVNKTRKSGKTKFEILPCAQFESNADYFDSPADYQMMKTFISDSRKLMQTQNLNVPEIK
jgi:poly-gamma-glutamate synthesis protein (capsule biosynthesis protein)